MDYDAKVIIKTEINNDDFDKDVVDLKSKLGTIGKKFTNLLGRGLRKAIGIGGKAGRIFLNIFKTITKIGLGAVGLSVALAGLVVGALLLSRAFEKALKDNKELKANIDYIKFAIIKAIDPTAESIAEIIVKIVNFLFKAVQYTAYLVKAWTGWDMFKDATPENYAKYMKESEKSSAKTAKNAKEIKKQLAGFDEMNVLTDNSSGNNNNNTMPTLDFSKLDDLEAPKWLITIKEIGEWIIENWQEVVFGLLLIRLFIDVITGNWVNVVLVFIALLVVGIMKLWDAIKTIVESVKEIWKMFWEYFKVALILAGNWLMQKLADIGTWFVNLFTKIKDGVVNAVQWVKDKFNGMVTFFSNLITKIVSLFKTIGTKVGDAIGGAFKSVINGVLSAIENILNFPIKQINKLLDVINKVPGINISKLSTFNLPRLAKGGIINMPGKGVALGGEVAPEGVIPLTDSQQMAILGEAIGKYVTINATIPVYAYNRQVAREVRRIEAEQNFALNR
jgi:hypothetical protein